MTGMAGSLRPRAVRIFCNVQGRGRFTGMAVLPSSTAARLEKYFTAWIGCSGILAYAENVIILGTEKITHTLSKVVLNR